MSSIIIPKRYRAMLPLITFLLLSLVILASIAEAWSFSTPYTKQCSPFMACSRQQNVYTVNKKNLWPRSSVTISRSGASFSKNQLCATKNDSDADESGNMFSSMSSPLDRPWLAAFDACVLLLFAAIGKQQHQSDGFDDIAATATTAFPFIVAWFATSPFTNVYGNPPSIPHGDNEEQSGLKESFLQIVPGWALAVPLGIVLRGIIKGYVPPVPFAIVAMISTLILLGGGRIIFNFVEDFFVELVN